MAQHASIPAAQEAETGESVSSRTDLHTEFQASQGDTVRACLDFPPIFKKENWPIK